MQASSVDLRSHPPVPFPKKMANGKMTLVRPIHRSKLLIPGGNLEDLALLHCEWTLGLGRFAALRQSRLAVGIPTDVRPTDLVGEHEAVEARFSVKSVREALDLAEACFPDRLTVLASARASADASPFRDPARIFEVLSLLAFFGRHDGDCEAALQKVTGAGARWRPRDSPDTTARFGGQRTWVGGDGTRRLFRRHLTLSHGVDAQRCAQIYYDVAGDGRIEIAWVGEHRPTVSEDT